MIPDVENHSDDDVLLQDAEDDLSGDGDEEGDGDGEDEASLALNTPEPARALQAANPLAKGKGDAKAKKGLKGKAAEKAASGDAARAVDVTIGDAATGLEESAAEEKPDAETQDLSAFDRDEITDPDLDIHETELLSMLAGLREKPWENEKLSLTERMMMKQGYDRNVEALQRSNDEKDPDAKDDAKGRKTVRRGVAAAATVAVAVAAGMVATGIKTGAEKGPSVAGVSRGPQRSADQERAQPQAKVETRKVSTAISLLQARQNADDVTLRRMGPGLASSLVVGQKNTAQAQANDDQDPARKLLQDLVEDLAMDDNAGMSLQTSMPTPNPDPDMQFRQMMDMIYMSLGAETLMNVSPYRAAGWDEKRLEQKENSADMTVAPEPERQPAPAPEPDYRYNMQLNLGPGGPG